MGIDLISIFLEMDLAPPLQEARFVLCVSNPEVGDKAAEKFKFEVL